MKTAARFLLTMNLAAVFICSGRGMAIVLPHASSLEPTQRTLPGDLALILCERAASTPDFQKHGIVDAQIAVKRLIPKNPQDHIKLSALREMALKDAMKTDNIGFAYGLCTDGSAWMVSMPSREQISVVEESVRIPSAVASSCVQGSLDIRFAGEKRGRSLSVPRSLSAGGDLIAVLPNARGFAGVSCTLKNRVNSGPRELVIIPVGGVAIGGISKDVEDVLAETDVLRWMNRRRVEESLPSLTQSHELASAANSLIGRASISHDLAAMAKASNVLRGKGIEAIGENRAAGRSYAELLTMFWQSPSHRDLMLNPRANLYGVASQVRETSVFISVVVAAQVNAPVAKLQN
jgi:uncharacterized protein YkwD